jgi:hypothetical protein
VIERFSDVKVEEVLACTDDPGFFCGSGHPDHEACLVRLPGEPLVATLEADKRKTSYPLLRILVGGDAPRYKQSVRRERGGPPREESIHLNSAGNLAVLYLVEERCFDINEVI